MISSKAMVIPYLYVHHGLMRDLKKASAIIESVVNAVDIPVSLKARLGWDDDSKNAKDLGLLAEKCGVQLITIHGSYIRIISVTSIHGSQHCLNARIFRIFNFIWHLWPFIWN